MNPDKLDSLLPPLIDDFDIPFLCKRMFILRNLIPFGKIGIKVVFPGKKTVRGNPAGCGKPQLDGKLHSLPVHHRKGTGLARADRTGLRVWVFTELSGATAENFGSSQELGMNLKPDNRFIFHELHLFIASNGLKL
jgi:hypothetical protein